jgi:molybdopterin molybdotransferase
MPVSEALQRVLAEAAPLATESIALDDALGRVLADDLAAKRTQPPADVSAMDGYAVRAGDVASAPVTLDLIGEVAAGHPFKGEVKAGQAVRIFTGGVLPAGADCVVVQEVTRREGDRVVIERSGIKGKNIRRKGIDFNEGDVLLTRGTRFNDRDLMLAASMNYARVPVHRRPKVAVLGTGDELVLPGSDLQPGQIVYSNGYALTALARLEGAEARDFGIAHDSIEDIVELMLQARDWGADVLVTTGGASVGEHDLVQRALRSEGMELSFWRVALRPGRPMMHGRLGPLQVLGVPGNPVSSYVCSFLFLVPLIRKLSGRTEVEHVRERAKLGRDLPENDEREDYLRAVLTRDADGEIATPVTTQDSSLMAPLSRSGCLVIRPPHAPAAAAGSACNILKFSL